MPASATRAPSRLRHDAEPLVSGRVTCSITRAAVDGRWRRVASPVEGREAAADVQQVQIESRLHRRLPHGRDLVERVRPHRRIAGLRADVKAQAHGPQAPTRAPAPSASWRCRAWCRTCGSAASRRPRLRPAGGCRPPHPAHARRSSRSLPPRRRHKSVDARAVRRRRCPTRVSPCCRRKSPRGAHHATGTARSRRARPHRKCEPRSTSRSMIWSAGFRLDRVVDRGRTEARVQRVELRLDAVELDHQRRAVELMRGDEALDPGGRNGKGSREIGYCSGHGHLRKTGGP